MPDGSKDIETREHGSDGNGNQDKENNLKQDDKEKAGKLDSWRAMRIFATYWILFAVLGGFNIYNYTQSRSVLSLVVAILCGVVFIGWAIFYLVYVKRPRQ